MTEYQKECMFCKQQITMSDETGKWFPYNNDGSSHDCKNKAKGTGTGTRTPTEINQKEDPLQQKIEIKHEITLEQLLQKLESFGIIINVERLMKIGSK